MPDALQKAEEVLGAIPRPRGTTLIVGQRTVEASYIESIRASVPTYSPIAS